MHEYVDRERDLGGSLAGLRIGLPNQPSPEGDKEPPCQGNQRSQ